MHIAISAPIKKEFEETVSRFLRRFLTQLSQLETAYKSP